MQLWEYSTVERSRKQYCWWCNSFRSLERDGKNSCFKHSPINYNFKSSLVYLYGSMRTHHFSHFRIQEISSLLRHIHLSSALSIQRRAKLTWIHVFNSTMCMGEGAKREHWRNMLGNITNTFYSFAVAAQFHVQVHNVDLHYDIMMSVSSFW